MRAGLGPRSELESRHTAQRSGSCLPIESILDTQWPVLFPDQFRKGDVPSLCRSDPPKPLRAGFLSLFIGCTAAISQSDQTPIREIPMLRARARCEDRIKALVRATEGSYEKRDGDINKVTLFGGACWREVDRCRGFFFGHFRVSMRIKCTFVT